MSAILAWLITNPTVIALFGAVAAALGVYVKGRSDGASRAANKTLKGQVAAQNEQLEMHREATTIERDAVAQTDDAARKEAMAWARRR